MPRMVVRDFGTCLRLDGSTNSVALASALSFSGPFSLAWWYSNAARTASSNQQMLAHSTNTNKVGIVSGSFFVRVLNSGSGDSTVLAPPPGPWHHLALVRDRGNLCTLYLDGVPNSLFSGAAQAGTVLWNLFGNDSLGTDWFPGTLAEVQAYSGALSAAQVGQLFLQGGLVSGVPLAGYWPCNEGMGSSLTDRSGNGNTGTIGGTLGNQWSGNVPMRSRMAVRDFGTCGQFDGSTNYVAVTNNAGLGVTSAVTIAWWMDLSTLTVSGNYACPFSKDNDPGVSTDYRVLVNLSTQQLLFQASNSAIRQSANLPIKLTRGAWHHYAVTYNGATVAMYMDGLPFASIAQTGTISNLYSSVHIGKTFGSNYFVPGLLDEVQVYGTALTASQVTQIYQQGGAIPNAGLAGYWTFDDGSGSTVIDHSGNGNTGTWQGTLGKQWSSNVVMKARTPVASLSGAQPAIAFGRTGQTAAYGIVSEYPSFYNLTAMTIEAWVKCPMFPSSNTSGIAYYYTSAHGGWEFYIGNTGYPFFVVNTGGGAVFRNGPAPLRPGQWTHVMGVYDGTNAYVFTNGVKGSPTAVSGVVPQAQSSLVLGNSTAAGSSANGFIGAMGEVRYSNIARHTSNFTPPTAPYTSDANTITLWHCLDGVGLTLADSGPNGYSVALAGNPSPLWVPGWYNTTPARRYPTPVARSMA